MPARELPEPVRAFLDAHVDAYEQLELLLLLRARGEPLGCADIAAMLGMELEVCRGAAGRLREHGLLRAWGEPAVFEYAPSREEDARTVDVLARVQAEDPVLLVRAMTASSLERLRRTTLRAFAEAFRLKEPKDHG